MYPVAHIVVASGAAWGAERAVRRILRSRLADGDAKPAGSGSVFDYRLVAIGSWLPDAIDKPLAWFIIADRVEDDHLLAHTLAFGLVLAVPALYLAWWGRNTLISLTAGVMAHRLCDPMWSEPESVLWPFYGWTFHHSTTPYFAIYLALEVLAGAALFVVLRRVWLRDRMWPLVLDGQI
jgi:hypothetical protein